LKTNYFKNLVWSFNIIVIIRTNLSYNSIAIFHYSEFVIRVINLVTGNSSIKTLVFFLDLILNLVNILKTFSFFKVCNEVLIVEILTHAWWNKGQQKHD
jgi:hypothetical protein